MESNNRRLFTVIEAAHVLSVCPRTIANLTARGKLGTVRIGRCLRIRSEEIERFINANERKPTGWKKAAHVG